MKDLEGIPDRTRAAAWQPIESAPRFGLLLLAVECAGERRVFVAQGDQHPTGWRWITCVDVASWDALHGDWRPTHWMPLPNAPEEPSPLLTAEEGPGCKPPTSS